MDGWHSWSPAHPPSLQRKKHSTLRNTNLTEGARRLAKASIPACLLALATSSSSSSKLLLLRLPTQTSYLQRTMIMAGWTRLRHRQLRHTEVSWTRPKGWVQHTTCRALCTLHRRILPRLLLALMNMAVLAFRRWATNRFYCSHTTRIITITMPIRTITTPSTPVRISMICTRASQQAHNRSRRVTAKLTMVQTC